MDLKKLIMIILTFSFLLNVSFAASDLQIVVDEITPLPVEPGQDMTIKVRLENIGDTNAEDIHINRIYNFPFKMINELQNSIDIENLGSGSSREFTFYISVSLKAKTGTYPLTFEIIEGVSTKTQDILINVIGKPDIIFEVNNVDENIIPGTSFEANLELSNIGSGNARNIKISCDYENFAFKDSSMVFVDDLKSQDSENLSFNILIDSGVVAGLYQIPININMVGENGQSYTSTQKLNVNVIDSAEVTLKDIKIKPAGATIGKPVSIEVRVENIGVGAADNVYVELKFEDGSSITGNKKAYIGHLDITDESPAFFNLNSKVAGKYPAKVLIHYTDDLGEHITEESLNISYKEDTSINYTLYSFIALLLIIVIVLYRRYKK